MNEPINYGWFEKDLREDSEKETCAIEAHCKREFERAGEWPKAVWISCRCPKCRINC